MDLHMEFFNTPCVDLRSWQIDHVTQTIFSILVSSCYASLRIDHLHILHRVRESVSAYIAV